MTSTDDILYEKRGGLGLAVLNRPKALNALNHHMVLSFSAQLDLWEKDPEIRVVCLMGSGGKAFCAGGDIRAIYDARQNGDPIPTEFFRDEYRLNDQIARYSKPYVALIDGIVMGGGAGLSMHGAYRVGAERTLFSMPETGIGFFPDVGATAFLNRLPGELGLYCALSSARLMQVDAYGAGLLTHAVKREAFDDILTALETTQDVAETLAAFHHEPLASGLLARQSLVDKAFSAKSMEKILKDLEKTAGKTGREATVAKIMAETLIEKSPTSLHVTLEQMRRGRGQVLRNCLVMEFRILNRILQADDFYEGVRAVLVDKDHSPKWSPPVLEEVDSAVVASYFEVPDGGDLTFDG
ncbi:enoyl-CoA hydratase/isomerase family protein [Roseibium sp.]|uniref:enoyl-CoA hydratase/isomerase family protein n=1 Tax=Roseibium sp. TaxID=1936156 RepID=UPI003A9751DE